MKVGTKELKNRLSHYLRRVRDGEYVPVADHGAIVAEIRVARASAGNDDACLQALEERGLATVGLNRPRDFAPVRAGGDKMLSKMIIEDRE